MTELINTIDETFNFNEKTIRTLKLDKETWFVAKDICSILELTNITRSLCNIPENQRGLTLIKSSGGNQNFLTIAEQAMYKLVMKSNKPIAQQFQDYVCREILPSIRKSGRYKLDELCKDAEHSNLIPVQETKDDKKFIEESNKMKQVLDTKEKEIKQLTEKFNKMNQVFILKTKEIKQLTEESKNLTHSFEAKDKQIKTLIEESNELRLQLEQRTNVNKNKEYQVSVNTNEQKIANTSNGLFNCALKLANGSSVTIPMREDGYINATMLCKAHGKKLLANYNQNKQTKEYLEELSINIGIPIFELFVTTVGGNHQGTWVHRKVAIHLAQWLSPNFAVQVSNWVDELRLQLEEKNKILETKDNEIKTLIEETKQSQDSLNTKEEKLTNGLFNCSLKLLDNSCMTIPMREDGYVNVTLLCKAGGKDIKEWKKNKSSVDILNAYFSLGGIPPSQLLNSTRVGKTQHTFAHPDIAIQIAQWADPYFALQVSRWTRELLVYGKVELGKEKSSEELENKLHEQIKLLTEEKLELKEENKFLTEAHIEQNKEIKNLQNKVIQKQRKPKCDDRNCVYLVQDEHHKKERIYIIGKAIDLYGRLSSYNKTHDTEIIYYRSCNSAKQMNHIEKCVLTKLDKYREVANHDRFILPENKDISLFTNVFDLFVDAFSDVDESVDIEKDLTEDKIKQRQMDARREYIEDNRETINENRRVYNKENSEQIALVHKQYVENNKEKSDAYQVEYREHNKDALNSYSKKYYEEHREEHNDITAKYRGEHRDEINENSRKYYDEHTEEFKEYKKEYYEKNKESVLERAKEYYIENKEIVLEKTKERYVENKDKILAYQAEKILCECGITLQRNFMAKHKRTEIHRLSLENKLAGNPSQEVLKITCSCGHEVRSNYMKRHLGSKIHEAGLKIQQKKINVEVENNPEL
jgi:prophage antirepressor-like protein